MEAQGKPYCNMKQRKEKSWKEDLRRGGTLHSILLFLALIKVCKLLEENLKEFKPIIFFEDYIYMPTQQKNLSQDFLICFY